MEIAAILEGREAPSDDVALTTRMLTPAEQRAQTAMSLQEVCMVNSDWSSSGH